MYMYGCAGNCGCSAAEMSPWSHHEYTSPEISRIFLYACGTRGRQAGRHHAVSAMLHGMASVCCQAAAPPAPPTYRVLGEDAVVHMQLPRLVHGHDFPSREEHDLHDAPHILPHSLDLEVLLQASHLPRTQDTGPHKKYEDRCP